MKTMENIFVLGMIVSGLANAGANPNQFNEQGFSGEVSLFTGYESGKSNLDAEDFSDTKTGTLNSESQSESSAIVAPLGQLRYTFGDQQVFVGMAREDLVEGMVAAEIGYAFLADGDSSISFSFLPTIASGETWEDPYVLNAKRDKTDSSGNVYRFQYDNVLSTGLNTEVAYYDRDIDSERSGSFLDINNSETLNRNGDGYLIGIDKVVPISTSMSLKPKLTYQKYSADGSAMAFDKYQLGLTFSKEWGRHSLFVNSSYSIADYDGVNPVFNKTQENDSYESTISYEYNNFWGWENVDFNALISYEMVDSNIEFYNENSLVAVVGLTYSF